MKRKIFMKTAGGGGFPRLARVMTCLMLMLTGLGTGVKAADVDLSTLAADYTAQNGDVLKGTLAGNVKITIANGATVTLDGVNINGENNFNCKWAGLNLAGDGTIILSGTNTVKGFYDEYPGIHVPSGSTLTIQGDGSLNASSNGFGAGIGGGWQIACGNISITGGTINATGGDGAAGIGGGMEQGSCGDITIEGGTITATGGLNAAGIGSGAGGSCGTITITDGVTSVTATKGNSAPNSIGAGYNGSCGTVTIGGNVTGNVTDSPYTYTGTGGSAPAAEGFTAALAEGTEDAEKWTLKVGDDGTAQALPVEGLSEGQTLTLTYSGSRRVKSVKAIVVPAEAAAKEPATVTTAPTGAAIVGRLNTTSTALVSGGAADGGTLWYAVTTTNTKPASTAGFSDAVPTAKDITASGKVYVWYFVKADDTHSDSEIAATAIEVPVADVVWDITNVRELYVSGTYTSYEKEGITLSGNGEEVFASWSGNGNPTTSGIRFDAMASGGYTFTAPTGKAFAKIEMTLIGPVGWDMANLGDGWAFNIDWETYNFTATWTGSAASAVGLLTGAGEFQGDKAKYIAFYLSE